MIKIAFIDLLFHWPPIGGSWVDTYEIIKAFTEKSKDYSVKLFMVDMPRYFPRGVVKEKLPFPSEKIKFNRFSYNFYNAPRKIKKALDNFNPDIVIVCDGYFMKPRVVNYLSKFYKVFMRFFTYEIYCLKNNLYNSITSKNCENSFLKNKKECLECSKVYSIFRTVIKLLLNKNIHFEHEYFMSGANFKSYAKIFKNALKNASALIVYNDFFKNRLTEYNKNVFILPPPTDLNYFKPPENIKKNDIFTILFSGRTNDYVKGFHILFKAVKILKKRNITVKVWYTSENNQPLTSDKAFEDIGWLNREKILYYYQNCDILINASIWREAFGITIIEALACGKPVIASNIGGMKKSVKNEFNGLFFEPDNPEDLADKIQKLYTDKKLYHTLSANAQKSVLDFSPEKIVTVLQEKIAAFIQKNE